MSDLYVQSSDYKLSYSEGRLIVRQTDHEIDREIALSLIDAILVFGNPQFTTQLLKQLAYRGINVYFFSENGQFLSSVQSSQLGDYEKQQKQAEAHFDGVFRLAMAKKIALAKIENQIALLRAYDTDGLLDEGDDKRMTDLMVKVGAAASIEEVMGCEGRLAKSYFYYLNFLVPDDFRFDGRSRRPAKDPFNALLNYGYSILYSFFTGMILKNGLSLGFAMIHQAHQHHATLASDLMEEWRPVIVDDTVMSLLQKEELRQEHFQNSGVEILLTREGQRVFLQAMRERMLEVHEYLSMDAKRYTFIYAADRQIKSLMRAFEAKDASAYQPIEVKE